MNKKPDIEALIRPHNTAHICVDMQRLFGEETPWQTPWFPRILPQIVALTETNPEKTIFTRFITAQRPGLGQGAWRTYYERWADITIDNLGADMIALTPALARFTPPAQIIDKTVYSPWWHPHLHSTLQQQNIETLIITGGETDICVLATIFGAIDLGYHIILAQDAICSSRDQTHDATLKLYTTRLGTQVTVADTAAIIDAWKVF